MLFWYYIAASGMFFCCAFLGLGGSIFAVFSGGFKGKSRIASAEDVRA